MQSLIGNGLKYHGDKSPRVYVSAERNGNEWIFSVRDNGIGIDPKYHKRIFEIFKRLHDQKEYPGTGIGLAVCRRVVTRHGGRIWLESEAGRGSEVHFTLPEGTDRQMTSKLVSRRPAEILLAEDNENDVELTRLAFKKSKLILNLHHVPDGENAWPFCASKASTPMLRHRT